MTAATGIPITYVPARNTVFLALALAWAETLEAFDIFIGANCVDYSGYPDCRPEYLRCFEALANLATRAGVEERGRFRIHSPLLTLNKEQIILRGRELGVDFGLTHSCYDPDAGGRRLRTMRRVPDPPIGIRPAGALGSDPLRHATADSGHRSPVDPLVRRVVQVDFLFVEVALVAAADEIDPERLVLDGRLAAVRVGNLFVAVGEASHVDAEAVGLGIPLVPDRDAEDGVIHVLLGAGRNDSHDVDRPPNRDRGIFAGLDQGNRLRDDLVFELLALLVDHDELGNEHPRLAGAIDDLVVEVMDWFVGPCRGSRRSGSAGA